MPKAPHHVAERDVFAKTVPNAICLACGDFPIVQSDHGIQYPRAPNRLRPQHNLSPACRLRDLAQGPSVPVKAHRHARPPRPRRSRGRASSASFPIGAGKNDAPPQFPDPISSVAGAFRVGSGGFTRCNWLPSRGRRRLQHPRRGQRKVATKRNRLPKVGRRACRHENKPAGPSKRQSPKACGPTLEPRRGRPH